MAKRGFWSLGATLLVGGLLLGCSPPDGDKGAVTEVKGAVTSPLFSPYVAYPVGSSTSSPAAVAIGDLDGDGRSDIAITVVGGDPVKDNAVYVFLQAADGTLKPGVTYLLGTTPGAIEIGDLNGDGRADVVIAISGGIGVMLQNASGTLDPMVSYPTLGSTWNQFKIGDFNGDGRMDVAGLNSNAVGIFLQTATGTLASPVAYAGGGAELAAGDLNSDGRTDLVVRPSQGVGIPNMFVRLQNADGTIGSPTPYSLNNNNINNFVVNGIAVADLDGDGRSDIVTAGGFSNEYYVARLLQSAQGTLDPAAFNTIGSVHTQPFLIKLANLDSKGPNDILLTHPLSALGVVRQSAPGVFSGEEFYGLPNTSFLQAKAFALGDINGDGLPDVVSADFLNNLIVLRHVDDVPPTVAITAPIGGMYYPNVPIAVAWTASDNAALAGFDLSSSVDGTTYVPIAGCTALPATARTCSWSATSPAAAVHIRVTARDTSGNQATADTVIALVTPTLSVTAPAAGAAVFVGASLTIAWTDNLPASATLLVELSRNGGGTFETLAAAAPNTGSLAWTATGPGSANAIVRVTANGPATASSTSGGFAIVTPVLTVTGPAPGAIAFAGTPVAITWADNLPASATLAVELSRDGGATFALLAAAAPNVGSFGWIASGPDTAAAVVRLTASGPAVAIGLGGTFGIVTPAVTVTGPSAGAVAFVGTPQTITWTDNLPADATMLVELSRDGGGSFETLASAAPNTGSFAWTATSPATAAALVRVTGNEPVPTSGLGALFAIVTPTLTVTSPTAGASWTVGTPQAITWTSNLSAAATVSVDLSRDGGGSYTTLAATAPNNGSFAWTATGPATASAIVRLTANGTVPASGVSGAFAIANPTLAITAPNTGASWTIGTAQAITWTTNLPATGTVRVELSRNGGTSYTSLAASAPNSGSFTWTVNGVATTSAIVRVSVNGATASATSGKFSLVAATVTVTSPNTAVTWLVGSVHAITWTHNAGTGAQFKIEVSRNSGSTWSLLTAAAPSGGATSGSYNWTVTAPRTTTARIRVTWTANTAVSDTSNVNFKIN